MYQILQQLRTYASHRHFVPPTHFVNLEQQATPALNELGDTKPCALQPGSVGGKVVQPAGPSVNCQNDERPDDQRIAEEESRVFATPLTSIKRDLPEALESNAYALRTCTTPHVMPNPQAPNSTCKASESSSHSPKESQSAVGNICGNCFRRIDADPIVCDGLCGLSVSVPFMRFLRPFFTHMD